MIPTEFIATLFFENEYRDGVSFAKKLPCGVIPKDIEGGYIDVFVDDSGDGLGENESEMEVQSVWLQVRPSGVFQKVHLIQKYGSDDEGKRLMSVDIEFLTQNGWVKTT